MASKALAVGQGAMSATKSRDDRSILVTVKLRIPHDPADPGMGNAKMVIGAMLHHGKVQAGLKEPSDA